MDALVKSGHNLMLGHVTKQTTYCASSICLLYQYHFLLTLHEQCHLQIQDLVQVPLLCCCAPHLLLNKCFHSCCVFVSYVQQMLSRPISYVNL